MTTSLAFPWRCSIEKVFVGATACRQSGAFIVGSLVGNSFCLAGDDVTAVGFGVAFGVQQDRSLLVLGQQWFPQQQEEGEVSSDLAF
jgi:hypothetical protein